MKFLRSLTPKKRNRLYLASIAALILIIIGVGITNKNKDDNSAIEEVIKKQVSTQTIAKQDEVVTSLSASGTIVPKLYSEIRSLTQGTVEYITPVGVDVAIGTPLFKIRDNAVENNYFNALQRSQQTKVITDDRIAQAKLGLNSAEAKYQLSQNNLASIINQTDQALENTKNSAVVSYNTAYNTLNQFYIFINKGNLDEPTYLYRPVVTSDTGIRETATLKLVNGLMMFNNLPRSASIDNLDNNLSQISITLDATKALIDESVILLQKTLGGIANLENNKTLMASYQAGINTQTSTILNAINSLRNTITNNSLAVNQAQNQLQLTKIDLDHAKISLSNAENSANLEKIISQAQLDNAGYNYSNLSINSPFAGTILSVATEPGQQVSVGQSIVELGNLSILEIRVEVDVKFTTDLKLNDKVLINQLYEGFISEIEPTGNLVSGKAGIKVQTKNDDNFLVAGNIAEVEFNLTHQEPELIIIPIKAATIESSDTYVYLFVDGLVIKRSITLGNVFGNKVSVKSGLAEGDELIIRNGVFISEGEEVEIVSSE